MNTPQVVHLPPSLEKEAARGRTGRRLAEPLVSPAVAQKIGVVETAADFFRRRAQGAPSVDVALAILDSGPDNPPDPGDELPEGYLSSRTET